ncbi:MAG: hypothetical protein NUV51_07320, partial [Sulfuricaulis sp.]|nr:hypothetical protein [Sulfuricaulis sp.]
GGVDSIGVCIMGLREWGRTIIVLALGAGAISACTMSPPPEPAPRHRSMPRAEQPDRVPGEYIVTFKAGAKDRQQDVRKAYSDFGVIDVKPIGNNRYVLKLERDPGFSVIKQKAEHTPAIESIQPNFIYRIQ